MTLTFTDGAAGQAEAFTCTPEHPFLVDGKGFVKAEDLGIGTSLVTRAGPCLTLSAVARGAAPMGAGLSLADKAGVKSGGLLVYNLRVEDDHSYFVGTLHGGTCVHNADYPPGGLFGDEAPAASEEMIDHHIATNKDESGWTPAFRKLFSDHGLDIGDATHRGDEANIVQVPRNYHVGNGRGHPEEYHQLVYNYLQKASGRDDLRARLGVLRELFTHEPWRINHSPHGPLWEPHSP